MWKFLRRHPQIFMPDPKEPHFFGTDIVYDGFVREEAAYLELFAAARPDQLIGEASVWYLYSKRSAAEIAAKNPNAKILIMLRDPIEHMHSLHANSVYLGQEPVPDFEAALAAEAERGRHPEQLRTTMWPEMLFYRDVADFVPQLERYLDAFPREQIHVLLYEDFASAAEDEYVKILRWLDVDTSFRPEFRVINANRENRSELARRWLRRRPPLATSLARRVLPFKARAWLWRHAKEATSAYRQRTPVEPSLRARLERELVPEVRRLSELLGRDLVRLWLPSIESQASVEQDARHRRRT